MLRSRILSVLLLLSLCSILPAEIVLEGEKTVALYDWAEVRVKSTEFKSFLYKVYGPDGQRVKTRKSDTGSLLFTGRAGTYRVEVTGVKNDKDGNPVLDEGTFTIVIGQEPTPPGPTPPGPTPPGPTPPGPAPTPTPDAKPIIGFPGVAVLIVYPEDKGKMNAKQTAILSSAKVYEWMKANCHRDDKVNPNGAFRIWSGDTNAKGAGPVWEAAMKRERLSLPWIVISTPKGGYEGPLPADTDATITLLKKHGE